MPDTSTRFAISEPLADRTDPADVPLYIRNIVTALEAKGAMYAQGTFSARPTSSVGTPGKQGRIYFATDTPTLIYYDTGTSWATIGVTALAAGSVGTTELADGAVTTIKLADSSVTSAKIVDATIVAADISDTLKPSAGAGAGTETLRALGTSAGTAATGSHETQHLPGGADALPWTTIHGFGTFASRPAAASSNLGYYYFSTDTLTLYQQQSGSWVSVNSSSVYSTTVGDGVSTSIVVTHNLGSQNVVVNVRLSASPYAKVEPEIQYTSSSTITLIFDIAPTAAQYTVTVMGGTNATATTPAAHASSHLPAGSDAIVWSTIHGRGTLSARPGAASSNANCRYVATDVNGGTEYQSDGAAWNQISVGIASEATFVTSLPGSPYDNQEVTLVDSLSAPTYAWRMKYMLAATKWIFVGGSALSAEVATSQGVTSATYTDEATAGPTVTAPRAGLYEIGFAALLTPSGSGFQAWASPKLGSATAADADGVFTQSATTSVTAPGARVIERTLAASDAVKLQYRASGGSVTAQNRNIWIRPKTLT